MRTQFLARVTSRVSWLHAVTIAGVVVLAGCAASSPDQRAASQPPASGSARGFASAEQCGQVADHLFTIELHGTSVGVTQEHLLNGSQLEYRNRYNSFVARCTTQLTPKDATCVLDAPAYQYIEQCEITQGTTSLLPMRTSSPHVPGDF